MTGPTGHEVAAALEALRDLQREADRDWPNGFDLNAVLTRASEQTAVLVLAIEAAPEAGRALLARGFVQAMHATSFQASVPLRRKHTGRKECAR